jgi:hypothetical protein
MANLTGNVFAAARTNINPTRHAINQSILKNNLTKQGKACMQIKHMSILYKYMSITERKHLQDGTHMNMTMVKGHLSFLGSF